MSDEVVGEIKVGPPREYEIIDKGTGLVEPVNRLGSGDEDGDGDSDLEVHKLDGTPVIFKREGQDENGNAIFVNSGYVIRDRETKLAPNGVDLVPDIVVASPEAVVEGGETVGAVTE